MSACALTDRRIISYCGFYCGGCLKLLNGVCSGCVTNDAITGCEVKDCCEIHAYPSCASCQDVTNITQCVKLQRCIENRVCGGCLSC